MAIRIRSNGEILCAAMFPAEPGDVYLDDAQHYVIGVQLRALRPFPHGRWRFVEQGSRDLCETCEEHMVYEDGRDIRGGESDGA